MKEYVCLNKECGRKSYSAISYIDMVRYNRYICEKCGTPIFYSKEEKRHLNKEKLKKEEELLQIILKKHEKFR